MQVRIYTILLLKSIYIVLIGIKPRDTITLLRQTTTTAFQPYDIYNLNASFQRERLQGLSANDALIRHLTDKGIHHKIQLTAENRTQCLFIAHPESIKLAQTNQDTVLIDNTYKTNKFDMPLLHMLGTYIYGSQILFTGYLRTSSRSTGYTRSVKHKFDP